MTKPSLGLVLLDTRFTRWPGDLGRADAWPVPVRRHVVAGAVPSEVVVSASTLAASGWAEVFEQAVRDLVAQGVSAVSTSCGFLVLMQSALQAAAGPIPVVSSALCLLPDVLAREESVGVLTFSAERLGPGHLMAAGVSASQLQRVHVQGMPRDGAFAAPIWGNRPGGDLRAAQDEVLQAGRTLKARVPGLKTVVLECTNLPPHEAALRDATGLRTLSLRDSPALRRLWRA